MSFNNLNADLSSLRINRETAPDSNNSSKKKLILFFSIIGVLTVVGFIFLATGGSVSSEKVEVATASFTYPSQANTVLTASGYVVAQVKAAVASKGTGRLEYLAVIEGDHVKKGNIIGRIESGDVEAVLGQAKAGLESAKADLEETVANFERQKKLFEQYSISKAEYDIANARYKRSVAGVQLAEAGVRSAEVQVENTFIRAPFDGTVLNKNANVGEVITPFGAAAGSRGALVTLADMSSLEVEADVSESNIEKIIPNQPCEITLDAFPEKRYRGFVHKIIPTADRAKATVLTKIRFNDRDDPVLPEMSAKVLFLNKKENTAVENSAPKLTVPSSAVVQRNGRNVVFIIREEKVTEISVVIGDSMGTLVEVKEGVANGDKIVLHPSGTLSSGTKISIEGK